MPRDLIAGGIQQVGLPKDDLDEYRSDLKVPRRSIATSNRTEVVPLVYGRVKIGYEQITPPFQATVVPVETDKK